MDAQTGQAVRAAEVVLERAGRGISRAVSDSLGRFQLSAPAGQYRVRASSIGYTAVTSAALSLSAREVVDVTLRLSVRAVELQALVITARQRLNPGMADFERRRLAGVGHFLTEADITRKAAITVSSVLLDVTGVYLQDEPALSNQTGRVIVMDGAVQKCRANVYIDGELMTAPSVDQLLTPERITGVEIYRHPALVPAEFMTPVGTCGVVAFWTREERTQRSMSWKKFALAGAFLGAALWSTR